MKRIYLLIISVMFILSFSACATNSVINSESGSSVENAQGVIDENKYIIQTPFYQIYEEDLQKYKYRITSGNDILVEDTKSGTAPQIEDKGDGIVKLHLGFGTNAFSVKYFNVYDKTISEEFNPYSIYADYINTKTKEYYIAYFKPEKKPKLYINGFFDSSEFSSELDLDFSMATCEKIIFLNEEEFYIEYIDSDSNNIKKVVNFKDETQSNFVKKELSDEKLAEIVAKNLGVPDNADIECDVSETYYWDAADRYYKNIAFTEKDETVAHASVDPYSGELLRNIYEYNSAN